MSKVKTGLRIRERTFKSLDGRLALAKTFRAIKGQLITSLGGNVSPQQEILLDRCVFILYKVKIFEALSLQGNAPAIDQVYLAWVNTLRRTLETLGLERRAREIVDLQTYLNSKTQEGDK